QPGERGCVSTPRERTALRFPPGADATGLAIPRPAEGATTMARAKTKPKQKNQPWEPMFRRIRSIYYAGTEETQRSPQRQQGADLACAAGSSDSSWPA